MDKVDTPDQYHGERRSIWGRPNWGENIKHFDLAFKQLGTEIPRQR